MTKEDKQESYEWNTALSSLEGMFWDSYIYDFSPEQVKRWLKDPVLYNRELRLVSRQLYNSNGIYTNVIDYMTSLPTLDRVVYSRNKNHKNYQVNKEKFLETLKLIKDKIFIRDSVSELGIDGTYFGYFETSQSTPMPQFLSDYEIDMIREINEEMNCSIISLPTDHCKIVGIKNSSYVMAFDVSYFDTFIGNGRALKLKRFPKEIRSKYAEYKKDLNKKWAVLDNSKTLVFKVRSSMKERWGRPLGLAAFVDMLYDDYFVETKRNVLDEVNNNIIYQTFPEGAEKGTSSLPQKKQKEQHDNIKGALFAKGNRKGVSFFSVASGTKIEKIKTNIELLNTKAEDELIKRMSTNLGFAGSALNGADGNYSSQQTNIDMVSAEIFSWIEQIQEELNKVINANVIKDKSCYVQLYYLPITYLNRKNMFGFMKELYTQGRGSLQAWIASAGFSPDAYLALMDEELELNFEEKYPVHQTSYTQSGKDVGNPGKDNPTNPNTIKSKTNNNGVRPK